MRQPLTPQQKPWNQALLYFCSEKMLYFSSAIKKNIVVEAKLIVKTRKYAEICNVATLQTN